MSWYLSSSVLFFSPQCSYAFDVSVSSLCSGLLSCDLCNYLLYSFLPLRLVVLSPPFLPPFFYVASVLVFLFSTPLLFFQSSAWLGFVRLRHCKRSPDSSYAVPTVQNRRCRWGWQCPPLDTRGIRALGGGDVIPPLKRLDCSLVWLLPFF